MIDKNEAIRSLVGGGITFGADGIATYHNNQTPPSEEAIQVEIVRLQSEYDALAWKRSRQGQEGYPSVGDQLDMLMKDMKNNTTTHRESCEAVKAKYPKP